MSWKDDPAQKPTGLHGVVFEFQIKTYLQHAWSIATHDLIYKTDEVNWGTSRIAYQVKATLENVELSIAEARKLTDAALLKKSDKSSDFLLITIKNICARWNRDQLPKDLRRMALNLTETVRLLGLDFAEVWKFLDEDTAKGSGTNILNLSPHGIVLSV
jgi:hypothetical protein